MVRKFADREKDLIRVKLLEHGRKLFAALGLKKTSVIDLTKAAGISQGAFYLFYESKEELYLAVLEQEEEQIRNRLAETFLPNGSITRSEFKRFLLQSLEVMESNPLIRQLYDEELMEQLFRKLPENKMQEHFADDSAFLLPFIMQSQEQGRMIRRDPDTIVSLIRSLILLSMQRRRIGEERYMSTMELLIDLIADGLIIEGGDRT